MLYTTELEEEDEQIVDSATFTNIYCNSLNNSLIHDMYMSKGLKTAVYGGGEPFYNGFIGSINYIILLLFT